MSVILIGAGPGDKGLLTLKGSLRLQNADVVLYDHFISEEIISMIPESAEKIEVGKHAGNYSVSQEEINRLLLEKARQGLNVVRLKSGDPFVFGRGGEEVEHLSENGIPVEVVPGVSSAIAGAAYAGIPVTHRDYASSLHIITGHARNFKISSIDYDALVKTKGTLVFLMSVAVIGDICRSCIAAGMDENMPAAAVENATVNFQQKFLGTVKTLPSIVQKNNVKSPAVFIIGKVCLLSDRYDWFSKKPLYAKRVIVVRGKPGTSSLADSLRELGCHVVEMSYNKIVPLTGPGCKLETIIKNTKDYGWLVFTSSIGVNIFFNYLIDNGFDIRLLGGLKLACVGSETEKEIKKRGVTVDYRPSEYNGAALARGLAGLVKKRVKLLILGTKSGAEDLTNLLTNEGILFDNVPIYEKIRDANRLKATAGILAENSADFVTFTSSSAAESFAETAANIDLKKIKAVCIGARTAVTAKSYGMEVYVSAEATIKGMVNTIKELSA
ncbi:MAG: uroporphyrinogen-III C-methyltransferase [Treponema sp.]|nr:uroporphyrinogen-III C-methyltransferase [Treponema sp.]